MTLILWKAPVVDDPDEAKALLQPYYENEDIARVRAELLRRFPDDASGESEASSPWADFPPEETDRLLLLNIRWSADNAVLDATIALAREHGLVLYDPQGPHVQLRPIRSSTRSRPSSVSPITPRPFSSCWQVWACSPAAGGFQLPVSTGCS